MANYELNRTNGHRRSTRRLLAASTALIVGLLGTPGTAAACSPPEEDFPISSEDAETIIEWESVDVGWDRGERAAVFVPVRYWGEAPTDSPEPYLARSYANRAALAGPDDCNFSSRASFDEPGEFRIGSDHGFAIEGGIEAIEQVHGQPVALEIDQAAVNSLTGQLQATQYSSWLYWRANWRWVPGLLVVATTFIFLGKRRWPWLRIPQDNNDQSADTNATT